MVDYRPIIIGVTIVGGIILLTRGAGAGNGGGTALFKVGNRVRLKAIPTQTGTVTAVLPPTATVPEFSYQVALDAGGSGTFLESILELIPAVFPPAFFSGTTIPQTIHDAILTVANESGIPRWFLYATVERESSFNPLARTGDGQPGGLTQLTNLEHNGMPYPFDLSVPDNNWPQWIFNMGINQDYNGGTANPWILMTDVNTMPPPNGWQDPLTNLRRFASTHAVDWYLNLQRRTRIASDPGLQQNLDRFQLWRATVANWKRGLFVHYTEAEADTNPEWIDYFHFQGNNGWDEMAAHYRPLTEHSDGIWAGPPHHPVFRQTFSINVQTHLGLTLRRR